MANVTIDDPNYTGQYAEITYCPPDGGTPLYLGLHQLPFTWITSIYNGNGSFIIYYPSLDIQCGECSTTSTTSTTTTKSCNCYTITNIDIDAVEYGFTDCYGTHITKQVLNIGSSINVCSWDVPVATIGIISVTPNGLCSFTGGGYECINLGCYCYTIVNNLATTSVFSYTDCTGVDYPSNSLGKYETIQVCASSVALVSGDINIIKGLDCIDSGGGYECPTTTTTSTANPAGRTVACGQVNSYYPGGQTYPTIDEVVLGSDIGTVLFQFNTIIQPDRIIVRYDSSIVFDTGYRGYSVFNYGGSLRSDFTDSLIGKVDPITGLTYPYSDPGNAADGYPFVTTTGVDVISFVKSTATTSAFVEIYAPMSGTGWEYQMNCPVPDPEIPCVCVVAENFSTSDSYAIFYRDCNNIPATIIIGHTAGVNNIVSFCTSDQISSDGGDDLSFSLTFNNCDGGSCPAYGCNCITFTNPNPGQMMDLYWKDCFGRNQYVGVATTSYQVCGSSASSTTIGVGITVGSACTSDPGTPLIYNC